MGGINYDRNNPDHNFVLVVLLVVPSRISASKSIDRSFAICGSAPCYKSVRYFKHFKGLLKYVN